MLRTSGTPEQPKKGSSQLDNIKKQRESYFFVNLIDSDLQIIGCKAGPERAPTTSPIPMAPTMHAMDWLNPGAIDASDICFKRKLGPSLGVFEEYGCLPNPKVNG